MKISIKSLKKILKESLLLHQEKKYFVICDSVTGKFLSQSERKYPHLSDRFQDFVKFNDPNKAIEYIKNSGRNYRGANLQVCKMDVTITQL